MSQNAIETHRFFCDNGLRRLESCNHKQQYGNRGKERVVAWSSSQKSLFAMVKNKERKKHKMKTIKTLAIGVAVLAVMSVTSVQAGLDTTGDPFVTGSWSQVFNDSGPAWNHMEAFYVSGPGNQFETPGFSGFSVGSWATSYSPNHIVATSGPSVTSMGWTMNFLGAAADGVVFNFALYSGNTAVEYTRATYNNGFTYADLGAANAPAPTPVPEPTTMMIAGALVLVPLGARTIRILRKKQTA
jgi:hypothetical protein